MLAFTCGRTLITLGCIACPASEAAAAQGRCTVLIWRHYIYRERFANRGNGLWSRLRALQGGIIYRVEDNMHENFPFAYDMHVSAGERSVRSCLAKQG